MANKVKKKTTIVSEHSMHVPVSEKNPSGTTIRDRHIRRLKGTYLDLIEIKEIFKSTTKKTIKIVEKYFIMIIISYIR